MPAPYPWQSQLWTRVLGLRTRLPHSVLLAGPRGIGKLALANAWAKSLLCEKPAEDGDACNACEACHWFDAGTHPDFMQLTLEEKQTKEGELKLAREVSVEQARQAVEFIQLSTYRAGRRLVLVQPAEALNNAAANALLKVLEEPPINTVFVLVSHQPRQLLPTILSRCHKLEVGFPDMQAMQKWLKANTLNELSLVWSGGAPLAALAARDAGSLELRRLVAEALCEPHKMDCVTLAEHWNKIVSAPLWQQISYKWMHDMQACQLGGQPLFNPDFAKPLQSLAKRTRLAALLDFARQESQTGRWVDHPLNRQMQIEAWLVRYVDIFERE